jgi:hypothetical protein
MRAGDCFDGPWVSVEDKAKSHGGVPPLNPRQMRVREDGGYADGLVFPPTRWSIVWPADQPSTVDGYIDKMLSTAFCCAVDG